MILDILFPKFLKLFEKIFDLYINFETLSTTFKDDSILKQFKIDLDIIWIHVDDIFKNI